MGLVYTFLRFLPSACFDTRAGQSTAIMSLTMKSLGGVLVFTAILSLIGCVMSSSSGYSLGTARYERERSKPNCRWRPSNVGYKIDYDYPENMHSLQPEAYEKTIQSGRSLNLEPEPSTESWKPQRYSIYTPAYDQIDRDDGPKFQGGFNYYLLQLDPRVNPPQKCKQRHEARLRDWEAGLYRGYEGEFYVAEHNDNILIKAMRHISNKRGKNNNKGFLDTVTDWGSHQRIYYNHMYRPDEVAERWQQHQNGDKISTLRKDVNGMWRFDEYRQS